MKEDIMTFSHAIITVNIIHKNETYDLEVPLDISASELCSVLYEKYLPERYGDMRTYYLKMERPIALLRGERLLGEYGMRNGSVINITGESVHEQTTLYTNRPKQ